MIQRTRALMWTIHGHDSFENSKGENAKCCPPMPQALSIKGEITLGNPQSRPLGRKWPVTLDLSGAELFGSAGAEPDFSVQLVDHACVDGQTGFFVTAQIPSTR